MIDLANEKNKKFGIFGLSRTGIATYKALLSKCTKLICYDDSKENRDKFVKEFGAQNLISIEEKDWHDLDEIILSPGVPTSLPKPHKIANIAEEYNIQIISDIDLLFRNKNNAFYICITGTNGKSTTTSLIHHILKNAGQDFDIGGNIGKAVMDMDNDSKGFVLELSSYQIELTNQFKPDIGIMLNITPDHLDRHGTMENYKNIKTRLLANSDKAIISIDDEIMKTIFENFVNKALAISLEQNVEYGISILNNKIIDLEAKLYDLPFNKSLQGIHNQQNIAASFAAAQLLRIKTNKILDAIKSFQGLPHRMEYLGKQNNIEFYNDSKATNAESTSHALSSLENIIWIAGGVAKDGGIESLRQYSSNISKAYFFGEAKAEFEKQWNNITPVQKCNNLDEAFELSYKEAASNAEPSVILLSPASASFDQYKNFEERGYHFKKLYDKIC